MGVTMPSSAESRQRLFPGRARCPLTWGYVLGVEVEVIVGRELGVLAGDNTARVLGYERIALRRTHLFFIPGHSYVGWVTEGAVATYYWASWA